MPEELIKKLARWASEMIWRYLADAPARNLGRHSFGQGQGVRAGAALDEAVTASAVTTEFRRCMAALRRYHKRAEKKESLHRKAVQSGPASAESGATNINLSVINLRSGQLRCHRVTAMLGLQRPSWAARCGWRFGAQTSCFIMVPLAEVQHRPEPLCDKGCFTSEERSQVGRA